MDNIITIRDKQTGELLDGPADAPFDTSRYEIAVEGPERPPPQDSLEESQFGLLKGETDWMSTQPPAREVGGNLVRMGVPLAVGAATGGLGFLPTLAALFAGGAAGESAGEYIEGSPQSPWRIGAAGALPAFMRPTRAVAGAVQGGTGQMNTALATGGKEVVNTTSLRQAADAIERRLGTPSTSPASTKLVENVRNRGSTLQDVEDARRAAGERTAFKAGRPAARQLYGAAKETMEQHDSPAARDLLEGISKEAARNELFRGLSLKELLGLFGMSGGGGYAGGWKGAAAGTLLPLLTRLYGASKAIRPHPVWDAGAGSGLSSALGSLDSP